MLERASEAPMGPLISVIIPTYDRARYVTGAVASALEQRGVTAEVIVVDDGSTDDTVARLMPYRDRIRYIHQANRGVSAARNAGLRAAEGTYIAFLDSDDIWEPFKLALQIAYLEAHANVDLICTDFATFTDDGPLAGVGLRETYRSVQRHGGRFHEMFPVSEAFDFDNRRIPAHRGKVFDAVVEGYFTQTSTVVLRREVVRCCGFFAEDLSTAEDWDYYLRLAKHHTFAYLDVPTMHLRRGHPDQLSGPRHVAEMARISLALVERIRQEDPTYYATHRALMDRLLRDHRQWVAWALYSQGNYRDAVGAYLQSLRRYPWRCRAYLYLCLALLRFSRRTSPVRPV